MSRAVSHIQAKARQLDLRGFLLPLLALAAWEVASHRGATGAYVFAPLERVVSSTIGLVLDGQLLVGWGASLARTSTGLLIGGLAGMIVGAVMGASRIADGLINPVYQAIRQVPLLGYIPLISLWMGNGESSKVFVIALAAFYPTVLNTYEGLRNADPRHLAVGRLFQASRWQVLRDITLPGALPSIFTGLMQAVAFAWLSSIGSELFFNPGPGLGNLMLNGQAAFRMDVVVGAVLAIGVTGFLTNELVGLVAGRVLRWRSVR